MQLLDDSPIKSNLIPLTLLWKIESKQFRPILIPQTTNLDHFKENMDRWSVSTYHRQRTKDQGKWIPTGCGHDRWWNPKGRRHDKLQFLIFSRQTMKVGRGMSP